MPAQTPKEKINQLLQLHKEGKSTSDICDLTGLTRPTVWTVLHRRHLKSNPSRQQVRIKENIQRVADLAELSLTVKEIAETLNISKGLVFDYFHQLGIPTCVVCRFRGDKKQRCLRCKKFRTMKQLHSKGGKVVQHYVCCGVLSSYERYHLVPGVAAKSAESANKYRRQHRDKNAAMTRKCNIEAKTRVFKAYGNKCQKRRFKLTTPCHGNLQLIHANHDGSEHRSALAGPSGSVGAGNMARFVRDVIKNGSKKDKLGKAWIKADFGILCESHHREYDYVSTSQKIKATKAANKDNTNGTHTT